jgi:hypothetical protein
MYARPGQSRCSGFDLGPWEGSETARISGRQCGPQTKLRQSLSVKDSLKWFLAV